MNSAISQQLLADFAAGADIFPHQYRPLLDQILLVRLSSQTVRGASFLDERVLPAGAQGAWFDAEAVAKAAANFPDTCVSYVFHAGHCGSTLVSRLLAAASDTASLREPLPLRALAFDLAEQGGAALSPEMFAALLGLLEKIWARGADGAVIKATSICTGLAERALARPNRKGIYVTQPPQIHLAVLLAGKNAAGDLRAFAQMRWRRLNAMTPLPPLADYSLGEMAALAWLTEGAAASAAALPIFDFENLLTNPAPSLADMAAALDVAAPPGRIEAAVSGPILKHYSKSPDHAYDAALRNDIISQSQRDNGEEIRKGMTFLERIAGDSGALCAVLEKWSG
jgi:hypothetical protein